MNLMPTSNDALNQEDIERCRAKHVRTTLLTKMKLCTIGNLSIQAILCVNTSSQTHVEKASTREHYIGADMTNSLCLLQMGRIVPKVWQNQSPLVEQKNSLTSCHEPEPYVRATATNGDHDATAETQTPATETTEPGADENYNDPDNKHEYVNIKIDDNIELKKCHSSDMDKQSSKLLLKATIVST